MYKDLKRYHAALSIKIDGLSKDAADKALSMHVERVRDFQHERLVHLIVTLFFGGMVVAGAISLYVATQSGLTGQVVRLLQMAVGILLITEFFYIGYYYQLENGVQKLYTLTARLQAIVSSK